MISLKLDELRRRMILAKPVHNLQGVLLLDQGTELTEKNIWILKSWGVNQVWVEGGSEEGKEKEKEEDVEPEKKMKYAIQEELKEKFSEVLDDQVMVEILRVAGKQLEKRFLEKEEQNDPH
ncbi:MAG: hypothetical protein JRJ69_07195 [Deltaproteobacteria bacterium]|nr:hypothetical protein [Deltaproteobacteria bacterium]MBW1737329.1 hypothetical protein [Deltaproteobacteria bacterium]MBW1909014.1 hypothetical protein [Deltaproteobacteria bacterium]MBW2114665.1 hypothetical protein [Deltaproteobacteria bacterium]MBW2168175.1 hypothetical protein [Deltaproteobacteria bacterium]